MKRSILIPSLRISASLIFCLGACSTARSAPSTAPSPSPRSDSTGIELPSNTWIPKIVPGVRHYLIQDSSTISINNDTTAHVEPIESTMLYTVSVTDSSGSLLLTGQVDSLLVNSRLPTKPKTDTTEVSKLHGAISRQGRLNNTVLANEKSCTTGSVSPSSRIGELLITLPVYPLKSGDKWSDTSSTTTCHGKIPLTHTAVREYELLDLSTCDHNGAKVHRVVSDSFTGSSTESTNHLSASGSGTASSILCLDRTTGALSASDGESRLELTVTTTRGVFPFTQKTSTHIRLQ
jgi:hypothetical protein